MIAGRIHACSLLVVASLAACQVRSADQLSSTNPAPEATAPGYPTPSLEMILPETVEAAENALPPTAAVAIPLPEAILPTAGAGPLRFVFPTQAPPPVSAWRPPLYPTPWAPTPYDHFYFSRPIAADEVNWPLADYRYGGVFLPEVVHTGIDIPAKPGTPVLAVGAGRVTWAGYGLYRGTEDPDDPYGLAVAIKHEFGYQGESLYTVYGHLNRVDVLRGQQVQAGEVIGIVGETGQVTGPHLHLEIRIGKNDFFVSRNPELWLSPPQGWGVLAGRVMNTRGNLLTDFQLTVQSRLNGQFWKAKTYNDGPINSDPYYQENFVLGDLPAGPYTITILFAGFTNQLDLDLAPGVVNYFTFQGRRGFQTDRPADIAPEFTPPASP